LRDGWRSARTGSWKCWTPSICTTSRRRCDTYRSVEGSCLLLRCPLQNHRSCQVYSCCPSNTKTRSTNREKTQIGTETTRFKIYEWEFLKKSSHSRFAMCCVMTFANFLISFAGGSPYRPWTVRK
jgi:hypothetical protein